MTIEKYVIEALDGEREALTGMFDTIEEARFHLEKGTCIMEYEFEFSDSHMVESWPNDNKEDDDDAAA